MYSKVRPYQEKDRDNIRKIVGDTADKAWRVKQKRREAVANMYVDYYIEYEPECCFVAVDENDEVIGYVVCSLDNEKFLKMGTTVIAKRLYRYNFFVGIFNDMGFRFGYKFNKKYGGGFHINVSQAYQGQKIGPKLLKALGEYVEAHGGKYLNLITKSRKTRGYGYYTHIGFKEAARHFTGALVLTYDLKDKEGYLSCLSYE